MKNEKRTLEIIVADLEAKVKAYNALDMGDVTRVSLMKDANDLVKEHAELSMLTVYAACLENKLPVKAFVEAKTYATKRLKRNEVKVPDAEGCLHLVVTYTIEDGAGDLDIVKFLEWAAAKGQEAAHSSDWREKMGAVKDAIRGEYRKCLNSKGETHKLSVKALKTVIQSMFDALLFVPTAKGENSIIADGYIARLYREFATQTNTKLAESDKIGSVLTGKIWNTLVMKTLLSAASGKKLIVDFDGEAAPAATEEPAAEATEAAAE